MSAGKPKYNFFKPLEFEGVKDKQVNKEISFSYKNGCKKIRHKETKSSLKFTKIYRKSSKQEIFYLNFILPEP